MRIRNLLLVIVLAAMTFGGTFTCTTSSHDHDDDVVHVTGTQKK
jgi:hypothetical protein